MTESRRYGRYVVELSRPDKVLFPDDGITKRDLADYYESVAETMLPHLAGRPLTMQRFPDGIGREGFYEKRAPGHFPDWVGRATFSTAEGEPITQIVCENTATLVYLADQACITPHVWLSRVDDLDAPDRLIFDLDPPDDDFGAVRQAARDLHDLLEELELATFVMTTGSRGLHVVVPLDRVADFDAARRFARDVADLLVGRRPDDYTTAARVAKRGDRLYLDTGRNAYGQTGVAPYAVRARPGAPVATPLDWPELEDPRIGPRRYTLRNLARRLGQKEDPWKGIGRHGRSLDAPASRLAEMREG